MDANFLPQVKARRRTKIMREENTDELGTGTEIMDSPDFGDVPHVETCGWGGAVHQKNKRRVEDFQGLHEVRVFSLEVEDFVQFRCRPDAQNVSDQYDARPKEEGGEEIGRASCRERV